MILLRILKNINFEAKIQKKQIEIRCINYNFYGKNSCYWT